MKRQFFYSPLPAPPAPPLPIINVGSIDELYDKVNDVDNEGRTIKLSPGVYRLDPSRGLLELQNNMSLIGQQGRRDLVVIDASNLIESNFNFSVQVTPLDSAKLEKGIIRLGKGTQSISFNYVVMRLHVYFIPLTLRIHNK